MKFYTPILTNQVYVTNFPYSVNSNPVSHAYSDPDISSTPVSLSFRYLRLIVIPTAINCSTSLISGNISYDIYPYFVNVSNLQIICFDVDCEAQLYRITLSPVNCRLIYQITQG